MSGRIRKAAAPIRARLQRLLGNLPTITRLPPERPPKELRRHFADMLDAHKLAYRQLTGTTALLSRCEDQWSEILSRPDINHA